MYEERERELAAAKAKAEEQRLLQEKADLEWQAEVEELQARRAAMPEEELEQDIRSQFPCLQLLQRMEAMNMPSGSNRVQHQGSRRSRLSTGNLEASRRSRVSLGNVEEAMGAVPSGEESCSTSVGVQPPEGPLEVFLAERLGAPPEEDGDDVQEDNPQAEGADFSARARHPPAGCRWPSFGELPTEATLSLATTLVDVLSADAADEDAQQAAEASMQVKTTDFGSQFDEILAKYAADVEGAPEVASDKGLTEEEVGRAKENAEALRARASRRRGVAARLAALAPAVQGDSASSRLVAALAIADVEDVRAASTASFRAKDDSYLNDPAFASESAVALGDYRGFRAPMRALSTADVCWGLCSEKKHLIIDQMLPSVGAEGGRWLWPQIRTSCVGWWLCGVGVTGAVPVSASEARAEQAAHLDKADAIVTKLAQSAVSHLRHYEKTGMLLGLPADAARNPVERTDSSNTKALRKLADEAVFWYVLLGTRLTKLKALLKTGVLRAEPAMSALLEHPRSDDLQFIRKNAFRLMQLHRFHLAAALFVLSESMEEAAFVVTAHLQDYQLLLLLARRRPDVSAPLLRTRLAELQENSNERAGRDPWLRLLLAWHAGDAESAWRVVSEVQRGGDAAAGGSPEADAGRPDEEDLVLFDESMRLSCSGAGRAGFLEVARTLIGPLDGLAGPQVG